LHLSDLKQISGPEWDQRKEGKRSSAGNLINNLKAQALAKSTNMIFYGFVNHELKQQAREMLPALEHQQSAK
jgi:hypothetical protein